MKRSLKIIIGVIIGIVLYFTIDLVCIFTINRPIFSQGEDYGTHAVYKGLFFNTYVCPEFSTPQIKVKGAKYTCAVLEYDMGSVVSIKDTTKDIKNFACDSALEKFYEDDMYKYSWSCIKNDYMIVEYENGNKETISDALKYGTITINDLDRFNIDYIKETHIK